MYYLKIGGQLLALILALDALAFFAWVLSGQTPVDACYFGTITAHIIKALLAL